MKHRFDHWMSIAGFSRAAMAGAALIWVSATCAPAAVPRDEAGLTAFVADAFAKSLPGAKITIKGPLLLRVETASGSLQIGLGNIADLCKRLPQECDREVQMFITNSTAVVKEMGAPILESELRVVVRNATYVETVRRELAGKPDSAIVAQTFLADLWEVCVADRPYATKAVAAADIAKLGLSTRDAIALGKRNVAAALRPLGPAVRDLPPDGIGLINDDFYDSSRLLLHADWAELSKRMNGQLVVAVPGTDVIMFGAATDADTLEAIGTLVVEESRKAARPLSTTLFKWIPDGWEVARR